MLLFTEAHLEYNAGLVISMGNRHGAQVIVEGREEQSDGGEKNKDNKTTQNQTNHSPQAESPPIMKSFLCAR